MLININDFKEAWKITKTFLNNETETLLMLNINVEPTATQYTIVKLPFGETISLLYCPTWDNSAGPRPGYNLEYSGFYSRKTGMIYEIRDQLNWFYKFGREQIYTNDLEKTVINAVKVAIANYIINHTEEFSGLAVLKRDNIITDDIEKAFSFKEAVLNFSEKIPIDKWDIVGSSKVEYIDNSDKFLKKKIELHIKDKKEELARLWAAHFIFQKLLEKLYDEYEGNNLPISDTASHIFNTIDSALAMAGYKIMDGDNKTVIIRHSPSDTDNEIKINEIIN